MITNHADMYTFHNIYCSNRQKSNDFNDLYKNLINKYELS
jgi:hypothetical protein